MRPAAAKGRISNSRLTEGSLALESSVERGHDGRGPGPSLEPLHPQDLPCFTHLR